ncbi:MAG TPA: hypothetical protein V6D07_16410 [Trichocoleus sp.]
MSSAIALAVIMMGLLSLVPLSAKAAPLCRQIENHQICILTIKRSAKYFWEYRAVVSVDGVPRPLEKYDCRQRVRVSQGGKVIPFSRNGAGDLICKLAN